MELNVISDPLNTTLKSVFRKILHANLEELAMWYKIFEKSRDFMRRTAIFGQFGSFKEG